MPECCLAFVTASVLPLRPDVVSVLHAPRSRALPTRRGALNRCEASSLGRHPWAGLRKKPVAELALIEYSSPRSISLSRSLAAIHCAAGVAAAAE